MLERLLAFTLGSAIAGIAVFEQRKCIYKSISDNQSQVASESPTREPIFAVKTQLEFAHLWNKNVDQTLGLLIDSFGSRRWQW